MTSTFDFETYLKKWPLRWPAGKDQKIARARLFAMLDDAFKEPAPGKHVISYYGGGKRAYFTSKGYCDQIIYQFHIVGLSAVYKGVL